MEDQELEEAVEEAARLLSQSEAPSDRFVHTLRKDIYRAATARMDSPPVPFSEMVVELRKLVRLLQRTLVPASPRRGFRWALGEELVSEGEAIVTRQQRIRWLMVGGVLGSVLSLGWVLVTIAARRRSGRLQTRETLSTT